MGFFSWKTQDTHRSISNHFSTLGTFPVFMHDNKGNKWEENDYEGYGVFDGKDYFELLAEMNGIEPDRRAAISLYFDKERECIFPLLTESSELPSYLDFNMKPEDCDLQGYFYGDCIEI